MTALVPASPALAVGSQQHVPGLYISVGQPTQLMRGQTASDGALQMEPVGAPAASSYNALAAHLPTSSLYAISNGGPGSGNPGGALLRVLDDGSTEDALPAGSLGGPSSAAAFGEGVLQDRMYYVLRDSKLLKWIDVVTLEETADPTPVNFDPIDMAWNAGYFWGLKGTGSEAKITRMSPEGDVTVAPIAPLDTTKLGGGNFGAAWTYGNGNLGFVSNAGGSVQLRITSADPIEVEIVGYSSGEVSSQLDAAMIPNPPGDLSVRFEATWSGGGEPIELSPVVKNVGATPITGYQLRVGPDETDSRVVEAPSECVVVSAEYQCGGGPLQPGEERRVTFNLQGPAGPEVAAQWVAIVESNEFDTDPSNNTDSFSPPGSVVVDVSTDVKARVIDTNGDGIASPGETIEVYVLVQNHSAETLTDVDVHINTLVTDSRTLEGEIAPGASRTVRFPHVIPARGEDFDGSIASGLNALVNGTPVATKSDALRVFGDRVTPNENAPDDAWPGSGDGRDPIVPPPGSGTADAGGGGSAGSDAGEAAAANAAATGTSAHAAGSGSSDTGAGASSAASADTSVGDSAAAHAGPNAHGQGTASNLVASELSRTGAPSGQGSLAALVAGLALGAAMWGLGVRRSRRRPH